MMCVTWWCSYNGCHEFPLTASIIGTSSEVAKKKIKGTRKNHCMLFLAQFSRVWVHDFSFQLKKIITHCASFYCPCWDCYIWGLVSCNSVIHDWVENIVLKRILTKLRSYNSATGRIGLAGCLWLEHIKVGCICNMLILDVIGLKLLIGTPLQICKLFSSSMWV